MNLAQILFFVQTVILSFPKFCIFFCAWNQSNTSVVGHEVGKTFKIIWTVSDVCCLCNVRGKYFLWCLFFVPPLSLNFSQQVSKCSLKHPVLLAVICCYCTWMLLMKWQTVRWGKHSKIIKLTLNLLVHFSFP